MDEHVIHDIGSFCMRCFTISNALTKDDINFCVDCGGEGTVINIDNKDALYLRENIQSAIDNARKNK
jgi:rRNA maturation endonuclease Nob1